MASKKLVVDVDLNGNKLLHLLLDPLANDPADEKTRVYYNTTDNTIRYHNGTSWRALATMADVANLTSTITTLSDTVTSHGTAITSLQTLTGEMGTALGNLEDTVEDLIGEGTGTIEDRVDVRVQGQLHLDYNSTAKKIYMYYGDTRTSSNTLGEIDCADFIKDGMIESVEYDADTHILTFTWNTEAGKSPSTTEVDLTGLIDTYTEGNGITISSNAISLKIDTANTESFLVLTSNGLKIAGVQTAINTAVSNAVAGVLKMATDTATSGSSKTITLPTGAVLVGVHCYINGEEVIASVSKSSGNFTVSWNITLVSGSPLEIVYSYK